MTKGHEEARKQAAREQEAVLADERKQEEVRAEATRREKQRDREIGEEFL